MSSNRAIQLASILRSHALSFSLLGKDNILRAQLFDAARFLDESAVLVLKKSWRITSSNGSRQLTWRERLAYKLLGNKTEIRP